MRSTTAWSIGCTATWLVLQAVLTTQIPSGLDDPDFRDKVETGSGIQSLGSMFLLAAIVLILITAYKNLSEKKDVVYNAPHVENSQDVNIVQHNSGTVTISDRHDSPRESILSVSAEHIDALHIIKSFLEESDHVDAKKARNLIQSAESELKQSGSSKTVIEYIGQAVSLVEKIAPIFGPVTDALKRLRVFV